MIRRNTIIWGFLLAAIIAFIVLRIYYYTSYSTSDPEETTHLFSEDNEIPLSGENSLISTPQNDKVVAIEEDKKAKILYRKLEEKMDRLPTDEEDMANIKFASWDDAKLLQDLKDFAEKYPNTDLGVEAKLRAAMIMSSRGMDNKDYKTARRYYEEIENTYYGQWAGIYAAGERFRIETECNCSFRQEALLRSDYLYEYFSKVDDKEVQKMELFHNKVRKQKYYLPIRKMCHPKDTLKYRHFLVLCQKGEVTTALSMAREMYENKQQCYLFTLLEYEIKRLEKGGCSYSDFDCFSCFNMDKPETIEASDAGK